MSKKVGGFIAASLAGFMLVGCGGGQQRLASTKPGSSTLASGQGTRQAPNSFGSQPQHVGTNQPFPQQQPLGTNQPDPLTGGTPLPNQNRVTQPNLGTGGFPPNGTPTSLTNPGAPEPNFPMNGPATIPAAGTNSLGNRPTGFESPPPSGPYPAPMVPAPR